MDTKAETILDNVRDKIIKNNLILAKKTGKIELVIEINVTQGAVGAASITNNTKEMLVLK